MGGSYFRGLSFLLRDVGNKIENRISLLDRLGFSFYAALQKCSVFFIASQHVFSRHNKKLLLEIRNTMYGCI